MAHKNREKRAAKKARELAKTKVEYEEEEYDDDYDYEDDDEDYYEDEDDVKKRRVHPAVVALIVTVIVVVGGYYGFNKAYENSLGPTDPGNEAEITVEIPEGSSTTAIAQILSGKDLIHSELFFRLHCRRVEYDGQFKHGIYSLNKNMSVDEIAAVIIQGTLAETKRFTIPEGYNTIQIGRALDEQGIVSEAEFYDVVQNGVFDYAFLDGCPPGAERFEGFLYPETYEVYDDATAFDVVSKMLAQFDAYFKDEYYSRADELGMSVRDIVTMASIVERESVAAEERPIMAGVFYNRLETGMRLESCATIQFILGEPKEFLTNADTQIESPYNTYLNDGLPPGPICNPRKESIEAAFYPEENDYIFFVLSDALDGRHKFSSSYDEFLVNKDAYYKAVEEAEAAAAEENQ